MASPSCNPLRSLPVGVAVWLGNRCRLIACLALALGGCATPLVNRAANPRPFDFQHDSFAYANQLVWEYHWDSQGKWVSQPREPRPDYSLHCFVVARSARQFFEHARFDPTLPVADDGAYRRLIREVVSVSTRQPLPENEKVVIPGYADLRGFSSAQEHLLKQECGSAWQSYIQRGHWRMIFPFGRNHQAHMAQQLVAEIHQNLPPVVHIVVFPQLSINHGMLLFAAAETEREIKFIAYDPNDPKIPSLLTFDRGTRTFNLPANDYFRGGRVDVYEVYRGVFY